MENNNLEETTNPVENNAPLEKVEQIEQEIVTARQPIVDKELNVFGYEFFSRSNAVDSEAKQVHTARSDTKNLFNLFSNFDTAKLLGGKKAFLNCILERSDILEYFVLINADNMVLEVAAPRHIDNIDSINEIAEKMIKLKEEGYTLACSEIVFEQNYSRWFDLVSIIKFANCTNMLTKESAPKLIENVRKSKYHNKTLVAERVETKVQFELLQKIGFDYYQGYFFAKPENIVTKVTNPSFPTIVKTINLIVAEAEFVEIEKVLKTDPTISFKLLRYLNSAGMSVGHKIDNFRGALMMLGYKKLLKWLSILCISVSNKKGMSVIAKTALTRAKFMENLALEMKHKDSDSYFMVGMFSMIDVLIDVQMDVAIESINLSEDVKLALLKDQGPYATYLQVAKSLEEQNWIDVFAALYKLNIPTDVMNKKYLEAVEWVEELTIGNGS